MKITGRQHRATIKYRAGPPFTKTLGTMFDIKVTAAAKAFLDKAIQELDLPRPGAVVYRQGAKADVTRSRSGKAVWDIEHPHPWAIELGSFETFPDNELVVVDGIKFHLALIPKEKEAGVLVDLREGKLYVEALSA